MLKMRKANNGRRMTDGRRTDRRTTDNIPWHKLTWSKTLGELIRDTENAAIDKDDHNTSIETGKQA